jgi:hypothetical protein
MVSVLTSSVEDYGFDPNYVFAKTIKLVFVSSPLLTVWNSKNKDWFGPKSEYFVWME